MTQVQFLLLAFSEGFLRFGRRVYPDVVNFASNPFGGFVGR
ncbi:hypothetical protein HanXRQr2_Chr09g0394621 [Helianthus annuus]|uniref:Uncharacterized protein n=1 Tax=Helianthus annuus TaxID=4232 RepID=A0A9K3I7M2_HELAN|nr:hypothetical protein HanXRQr2_Chr09g0394621 [Helianthus annuus]KAJ0893674.1 hypothetical protein HanPSC8_Chr09g0380451 [Helianthus annuus]